MKKINNPKPSAGKAGWEILREELAELEHKQWIVWSKTLAKSEKLSGERLKRWKFLWELPYDELSEQEKDMDREWADKVLAFLASELARGMKVNIEYKRGYFDALSFVVREIPMPIRNKIALQVLQDKLLIDLLKSNEPQRK